MRTRKSLGVLADITFIAFKHDLESDWAKGPEVDGLLSLGYVVEVHLMTLRCALEVKMGTSYC